MNTVADEPVWETAHRHYKHSVYWVDTPAEASLQSLAGEVNSRKHDPKYEGADFAIFIEAHYLVSALLYPNTGDFFEHESSRPGVQGGLIGRIFDIEIYTDAYAPQARRTLKGIEVRSTVLNREQPGA